MDRFLRKCLQLLKYGALIIAGGFYIWAIIILLNNDNWIGISTLTTMFLGIAAFWSIWQNHTFRKRDRRVIFLNGIRNWANEGLSLVTRYRSPTTNHANFPPVWEAVARLSYLSSQPFIEDFGNNDLRDAYNRAQTNIKKCLDWYKNGGAVNVLLTNAMDCEKTFIEVLNEVTKIRARDIA